MKLRELFRQAWISIMGTPLTWVCTFLLIIPGYIVEYLPDVLACIIVPIWLYFLFVAPLGLIIIASQPPPDEQLTFRRMLNPVFSTLMRFIAVEVIEFLVSVPIIIPFVFKNISEQLIQLNSEVSIPQIPLICTIPLIALLGPLIVTMEMAAREVVLADSGVIDAIKKVWAPTLQNLPLLVLIVGLSFAARFAAPTKPLPIGLLLSLILIPYPSALITWIYLMHVKKPDASDLGVST